MYVKLSRFQPERKDTGKTEPRQPQVPRLRPGCLAFQAPGPVSLVARSSPLPGQLLHFQLQTVDLVSEVLFEEPVVQLGRLAASFGLAQSGCGPHERVIKTKAMVGGRASPQCKTKQPKEDGTERQTEGSTLQNTKQEIMREKMEKKQILKKKQDEGEPGRGKADFPLFLFQYYSLQPLDDKQ